MFMNDFFSRSFAHWFVDFVDRVRAAFSIGNLPSRTNGHMLHPAKEPQTQAMETNLAEGGRIDTLIPDDPEIWFIKMVEDGLRNLPDIVLLGRSPLAGHVGVKGETQIARGKQLQQLLQEAIESLRPAGKRPAEPLPRAWYNYIVLYDAYVEGIPNREVMARLYISEGTFNRTRRKAVRGVATWLMEATDQRGNVL